MLRDRLPVLLAACIAALATFIRFDASSPEQPEAAAHPPPPTTGAPPERRDAMPAFYDDGGAPIVDGLERAPRTNLLAKLLRANCVLPRECAGVATRGAPGHSDASAVEAEIALAAAFHGARKGDRLSRAARRSSRSAPPEAIVMSAPRAAALREVSSNVDPPEAHQWVGVPSCVRSGMKALFKQCEAARSSRTGA
ncbi:hypothetical protein JL720_13773 [Aureococcus anophagefferens]|nr:hypothetical protein JL720_13773 [Aureococcus anophagefferens]